jgi:hypothetical protein
MLDGEVNGLEILTNLLIDENSDERMSIALLMF